jgi:myosin heavy subunit
LNFSFLRHLLTTLQDPSKFSLSHFAGSVPYEVSGWVSLNDSTAMEDNVEDILRHSSSDLVVDVLDTFRPPNPVDVWILSFLLLSPLSYFFI